MIDDLTARLPYVSFILLTVIGIYLMLSHRHYFKAVVGLQIFQTGIILFFILLATSSRDATVPIQPERPAAETGHAVDHGAEAAAGHAGHDTDADGHAKKSHYDAQAAMHNPLPHALMLTAIVVGVATQGVALAILRRVKQETGSIDDEFTETLES
jgi:multicomponent Na+:H+ antiporter subunit C